MRFSVCGHAHKTKCLSGNITTLHINAPVVFIPGEDFCKTLQMASENRNIQTETYAKFKTQQYQTEGTNYFKKVNWTEEINNI